jgi:hypothetical protein
MERHLQKAKEVLSQIDEGLETIAVASLEQKAKGLRKAVEDGWFKYYLIGAATAGTGLVYAGLTNDNDYVAGIGYGTLAMTGLYLLLYVPQSFGFFRTRKNRDNFEE